MGGRAGHRRLRLECLEGRDLLTLSPLGAAWEVNTFLAGTQRTMPQCPAPAVAMDADGDFVAVWASRDQDTSGYGVYARRFSAAGVPQGAEFRVNTTTSGPQTFPGVAMDAGGDFWVTWSSLGQDGSGYGVYARRFSAAGEPRGGEFRVNTFVAGNQNFSAVAVDPLGDGVVVWTSADQDGDRTGIFAQRYDAGGSPRGSEFRVNAFTAGNQRWPTVAMDSAGSFVVTWTSQDQDGSGGGVYAQRFASDGTPEGPELRVNSTTLGNQQFSPVAMRPGGDFIVAWQGFDGALGRWNVYVRRFDAQGSPQGSEALVGPGRSPSVTVGAGGDFVVAWEDYDPAAARPSEIVLAHFDRDGVASGERVRAHGSLPGSQQTPSAVLRNGEVAVVWTSDTLGPTGLDVRAARLQADVAEPVNHAPELGALGEAAVSSGAPLPIALAAGDADGDPLTFSVEVRGAGLAARIPQGNRSLRIVVRDFGTMEFQLFEDLVPRTTARIVALAESGFYDGLGFHRVARGVDGSPRFIQGGDPNGDGSGGSGVTFDDEFDPGLLHAAPGVLAAANRGDDTNDSQFLVTAAPLRQADFDNAIFGFLTAGDAVRAAIQSAPSDPTGRPSQPIVIDSVRVFRDSAHAVLLLEALEGTGAEADVTVTASDGRGASTSRTFHVVAQPDADPAGNSHPYLLPIGDVVAAAGTPVDVEIPALDVEGDPMEFWGTIEPPSPDVRVSVSGDRATVTPGPAAAGVYALRLGVRAPGSDRSDTQAVPVLVAPAPPTGLNLTPGCDTGASAADRRTSRNNTPGRLLEFEITGVVPGAEVTLLADGVAIGKAVAGASSVRITTNGTRPLADGPHAITATQALWGVPVDVGNRHTTADLASGPGAPLEIVVDTAAPTFTSQPVTHAAVGIVYAYDAQTDDESSGAAVAYALETCPAGMAVGGADGRIAWTPGESQGGTHRVAVTAADLAGNVGRQSFDLAVNRPPCLGPIADQQIGPGETLSFTAAASDPDSPPQRLTFRPEPDFPEGAQIDPQSGRFTWAVPADQAPGVYLATIRVADDGNPGLEDARTVTIRVVDPSWLGIVDFLVRPAAPVGDGDRFDLAPARNGRLTVEALFDAAAGNVDLALLGPTGQTIAAAAAPGSNERLDAVVQAGQRYRIRIAGGNPAVTLRLANLLVDGPGSLAVFGTAGDDVIQLSVGAEFLPGHPETYALVVNGVAYAIDAVQEPSVSIDAGAGRDVVVWTGSPAAETLELRPDRASLTAEGRGFTAVGAESIRAIGAGGDDEARLYDSPGDDTFQSTPDWASLSGTGFSLRAEGFRTVLAYAGSGGADLARLYDSPGVDAFTATPASATMQGESSFVRVESFRYQYGYSSGGSDIAVLDDSAGNDVFSATATYAALYGTGFYSRANAFPSVRARSTAGGSDIAKLYDSPGNDALTATPAYAAMTGAGFANRADAFRYVAASATSGGDDAAFLYDSSGDDVLSATPTYATLSGPAFSVRADAFDRVTAYSGGQAADVARLYDSPGDDTFTATAADALLVGSNFANRAEGFRFAYAYRSAGAGDQAVFHDSAADDVFTATPTYASMSGPSFYRRANGFPAVRGLSSAGGADLAKLYDSAGDDLLVCTPQGSVLSGSGYLAEAGGFSRTLAYATAGGTNTATFEDSPGDDTLLATPTYARFSGPGYLLQANSFQQVRALASHGGVDRASLYDSALSDYLEAEDDWAQLSNLTLRFSNRATGFRPVVAVSTAPGDTKRIAPTVDFLLLQGYW